jgi:hypothetical protein
VQLIQLCTDVLDGTSYVSNLKSSFVAFLLRKDGVDFYCDIARSVMYRTIGLIWTLSIVWYVEDHNVSETGSVSFLRWMGQDKPTQLGPLERASLNHWTLYLPHTRRWMESKTTPVALYNIHHRQNPYKSISVMQFRGSGYDKPCLSPPPPAGMYLILLHSCALPCNLIAKSAQIMSLQY